MSADITARLDEIRALLNAAYETPGRAQLFTDLADLRDQANAALLDLLIESPVAIPFLLDEITKRDAAVDGVLAVHQPFAALDVRVNRMRQVCTGCGTDGGNWQPYPCPTVRAVTEALGGAA